MSRKNVVGNHVRVHVIYYERERERDSIKVLILFSAVNEKTEHNFFTPTGKCKNIILIFLIFKSIILMRVIRTFVFKNLSIMDQR